MYFGRLFIVICMLFVTACATVPSKVVSTSQVHKIGVISALPETVQFSRSGITVFENVSSSEKVPEWRINDAILDGIQAALTPKYETVRRVGDPELGTHVLQAPLDEMMGSEKTSRGLSELLGDRPEDVDLWIVVSMSCADAGNYSGPVPCGVYVNRRSGMFDKQPAWLGVYATITVFDGRTKKHIANQNIFQKSGNCGPFGSSTNMFEAQGCVPSFDLGPEFAVDRWSDYSNAQRETIRNKLRDILAPSLAYSLARMNL